MQFENQCILQRNYEPFKILDGTGLDTITLVPKKVSPICSIEQFRIFRSPVITVFAAQGIDGDRMGVPVVFLTFFSHFSDLFLSSLLNT